MKKLFMIEDKKKIEERERNMGIEVDFDII